MKRILCFVLALSIFAGRAVADEGMWLLPLIQKMNEKDMKKADEGIKKAESDEKKKADSASVAPKSAEKQ